MNFYMTTLEVLYLFIYYFVIIDFIILSVYLYDSS